MAGQLPVRRPAPTGGATSGVAAVQPLAKLSARPRLLGDLLIPGPDPRMAQTRTMRPKWATAHCPRPGRPAFNASSQAGFRRKLWKAVLKAALANGARRLAPPGLFGAVEALADRPRWLVEACGAAAALILAVAVLQRAPPAALLRGRVLRSSGRPSTSSSSRSDRAPSGQAKSRWHVAEAARRCSLKAAEASSSSDERR